MTAMQLAGASDTPEDALFLTTLLRGLPSHLYFLIWTMPNKVTRTFKVENIDAALEYIDTVRQTHDVYVGVGIGSTPLKPNRRYENTKIVALVGLWADIDIKDETSHKSEALPETVDEAMRLVQNVGLEPTMLVHSGHGLHAWWLFDEPMLLETPEENDAAYEFVGRWFDALKRRSRAFGWKVDPVRDLSRVLRVPGTYNRKDVNESLPVHLLYADGPRYSGFDAFDESIADAPLDVMGAVGSAYANERPIYATSEEVRTLASTLKIDWEGANPPLEKWNDAQGENIELARLWDHSAKRGKDKSDSLSEWEMQLVLGVMHAGQHWTEQEIANLVIAHRRKWARNEDDIKKGMRRDYHARTILNARNKIAAELASERFQLQLQGHSFDPEPAPAPAPAPKPAASGAKKPLFQRANVNDWMATMGGAERDEEDEAKAPSAAPSLRLPEPVEAEEAEVMEEEDEENEPASTAVTTIQMALPTTPPTNDYERRVRACQALFHREDATPEMVLRSVNSMFQGIEILRFVRMVATPPLYTVTVRALGQTQTIHLGDIQGIRNQRKFVDTILTYTSVMIPGRKSQDWDGIVASLMAIAEDEDIGEEATETGQIGVWLAAYVDRYNIERDWVNEDGSGAPPEKGAFTYNGGLCISGGHMLHWLRTERFERISPQILGKLLRLINAETLSVPYKKPDGKRTSTHAWRLPETMAQRFLMTVDAEGSSVVVESDYGQE